MSVPGIDKIKIIGEIIEFEIESEPNGQSEVVYSDENEWVT